MKQSLKDFFEGVSIKKALFLIIWTAGTISWMYFYQEFSVIRCEANWAYQEAQKLQEQRRENKMDDGEAVSSKVEEATTQVSIVADTEDRIAVSIPTTQIEEIIYKYFKDDYKTALAVAKAESSLNSLAFNTNRNGTRDVGIFQINDCHKFSVRDRENPERNVEIARQIFEKSGWKAWSAYNSGRYLAFMN